MIRNILNGKKGGLMKVISVFAILAIFFLAISISLAAQNDTDSTDSSAENVSEQPLETTPVEESQAENDSETQTGEVPDTNESIGTENVTENITEDVVGENKTIEDGGVTDENQTLEENISNQTSQPVSGQAEENISESEDALGQVQPLPTPKLNVEISYPTKITRSESFKLKVTIKNVGNADAKSVFAEWKIPNGFEIISGDKIGTCGSIKELESCELSIDIVSTLSTSLGINEIKILVEYK